jgi:hypothetical protein
MAKISISLPDELVNYLDQKVEDKSIFITSILQQWRQQQEAEELAQACLIVDELELGCSCDWGRIRHWLYISELGKYLLVVTLDDGETIHNAFPDRNFKE